MMERDDQQNASDGSGVLLSRRDWVYLLALLVPLFVYNLSLKASSVASIPGLSPTFDLMRSDLFFNLGYALFWVGLFAAVHGGGTLRRFVVVLLHAVTMLLVVVTTFAHGYFQQTGTTLDYGVVALWLPKIREVVPVLASGATPWVWVLLLAALFYVALGPLLVTHAVERLARWRGRQESAQTRSQVSFLAPLGLLLLAFGFGSLSLLIGARSTDNPAGASVSFVRNPFVNLVLTGAKVAIADEATPDAGTADQDVEHPAANATLSETPQAEESNVVLIQLESTRARSVTPYDEDLDTTPFLDELANSPGSLLAERAYTTVPHTSKATVQDHRGLAPTPLP